MKEVKKRLNTKLECHLAGPHAFPLKVFAFIYTLLFSIKKKNKGVMIFFFFKRKKRRTEKTNTS